MSVEAPERPAHEQGFPTDEEFDKLVGSRQRVGTFAKFGLLSLLLIALLALGTLLYTVINDAFGLVAIVNERDPDAIVADLGYDPAEVTLDSLDKDELVGLLVESVSSGVGRRMEREQRFYEDRLIFEPQDSWDELCAGDEPEPGCTLGERDQPNVFALVQERVVVPDVIATYDLVPSILSPEAFEEEVRLGFVNAPERFGDYTIEQVEFEWKAWLNPTFVRTPSNSRPEIAGIRTAILGSAWLMLITILFAVPVGVGAAIYLVEFAKPTRINEIIQTNINNLAGVPSIIYGMLGLAVLVRTFEVFTSGAMFSGGAGADTGRTIVSGGITLGLLVLPVIIISAQEALKAVPNSLRQAGMALGATRWQTVKSQVMPVALPGILTGTILSVARAIGETAPLIVVGAASFITSDPTGPFSRYTALPIQIFQWTGFPQDEFRRIAAAAILVLLILLLVLNATAVFLRNKYSRRA